jgi:hypothetical protein
MTIKSLIAELEKYDEDLLVVVDGYEDGVTGKFKLLKVNIEKNVHKAWYYGESEVSDSENTTPVLYLRRERLSSDRILATPEKITADDWSHLESEIDKGMNSPMSAKTHEEIFEDLKRK